MKTPLAQRLRAARQALNPSVTQRDVAKRLELSPSAINLWESGKTEPGAPELVELSRWYQVSTDWLLGVESGKPVHQQTEGGQPVYTVPVVAPASLVRWHWDSVQELQQTAVAYPPQTAAAMLVSSDALTSICPPGSYAVISKAHQVRPGDVVLATTGPSSEPVLRRYVKEGADALLIADDMRYPSYRVEAGVKLLGRVVEVTTRRVLP